MYVANRFIKTAHDTQCISVKQIKVVSPGVQNEEDEVEEDEIKHDEASDQVLGHHYEQNMLTQSSRPPVATRDHGHHVDIVLMWRMSVI